MTTILALETSGSLCSVALICETGSFENTRNVERMHNQVLLGMLDDLFEQAAVAPAGVDVVAFGAGPGSFTGVRIAAAVAQGIGVGIGGKVVPVSSSLARAAVAFREHPDHTAVITLIRSRRDAYYLAGYTRSSGKIAISFADVLVTAWPDGLWDGQRLAVGDLPDWWSSDRPETLNFGGEALVTAPVIAELGLAAAHAGGAFDPALGLPVYLKGDSPWKPVDSGGSG
jgi:tRNA threonylcarbamoyladenosine biosynthesis protein TsaB